MARETTSGGMGIGSVLLVVFVTLKLTGNIAWSWWWVLSPLWGIPAVIIAVVAFVLLCKGLAWLACAPFTGFRRSRLRCHHGNEADICPTCQRFPLRTR